MDTNKIKKGLGRGLSSLIGETKTEININRLSISDLVSNKFQPRKIFDDGNLQDLTNSIKERGIIQPIIVRKSSDDNSKYEIIFPPFSTTLAAAEFEIENEHNVILCDIAPVPRTLPGNTTVSFSLVN